MGLIVNEQNGFRKNRSTDLDIYQLLKPIHQCIDKKIDILAIFTDMSKAFQSIRYEVLLSKLERYGSPRPKALNLIGLY